MSQPPLFHLSALGILLGLGLGCASFAELTQARSVGMQTVEVLLGERVIAQPRVVQAIAGGQFEIAWNLTPCEQAMDSSDKGEADHAFLRRARLCQAREFSKTEQQGCGLCSA